jgi:hypothetical protein
VHCGVVIDCVCAGFCRVLRVDSSEARAILEEYSGPRYEIESRRITVVDLFICNT